MTPSKASGRYSKAKGASWELAVARALGGKRRNRTGAKDQGDIEFDPRFVVEAKAEARYDFPGYLREAETERQNAEATYGVAWVKPKGVADALRGWVLMTGATFKAMHAEIQALRAENERLGNVVDVLTERRQGG